MQSEVHHFNKENSAMRIVFTMVLNHLWDVCRLRLFLSRAPSLHWTIIALAFLANCSTASRWMPSRSYQIIRCRINILLLLLASVLRFSRFSFILTLANKAILHTPITLLPKCTAQMPKSMWAIADHIIDAYTFTILVIFIIETDCFVKSFEIPRP